MSKKYDVTSTIYTGIVSGYDLQSSDNTEMTQASVNNAMDNLINILLSRSLLNKVAVRLFAQHMLKGNSNVDNKYILSSNYKRVYNTVPQEVLKLIDKSSEERTIANLMKFQSKDFDNYIYGLFNWTHPFYSYLALKEIQVKKVGNSDMIEVSYSNSDPGIAYNTLIILMEELSKEYVSMRYGETDNVIRYFEFELSKLKDALTKAEDSLTNYNIANRVINYEEQTKHVAALSRDFELVYSDILRRYESSKKQIEILDQRIGQYTDNAKNSADFLSRSNKISQLSTKIAKIEILGKKDSLTDLRSLKTELAKEEAQFKSFSKGFAAAQYSAEGISNLSFIEQWLQAKIDFAKAEAELGVMDDRLNILDNQYTFYSPVGTSIKRRERQISFVESSYLSVLQALNMARLRKKNLQLTSSSLKVISPPVFPLLCRPSKRKMIVIAAALGSIIFIIGIFLLIELLDRTLRDKFRTESLTGLGVIGSIPKSGRFRNRLYNKQCEEIALNQLCNTIYTFIVPNSVSLINIISLDEIKDTENIPELIKNGLSKLSLNVGVSVVGEDFSKDSRTYTLATSVDDVVNTDGLDIAIISTLPLQSNPVPKCLVKTAVLNLLLVSADRTWNQTDQSLIEINLLKNVDPSLVKICLLNTSREATELFTGLLPPYTFWRKFIYKLLQFGITAK